MERQIVDLDPGKNYNAAISAGDPHFEIVQIVARLQIVMLQFWGLVAL